MYQKRRHFIVSSFAIARAMHWNRLYLVTAITPAMSFSYIAVLSPGCGWYLSHPELSSPLHLAVEAVEEMSQREEEEGAVSIWNSDSSLCVSVAINRVWCGEPRVPRWEKCNIKVTNFPQSWVCGANHSLQPSGDLWISSTVQIDRGSPFRVLHYITGSLIWQITIRAHQDGANIIYLINCWTVFH